MRRIRRWRSSAAVVLLACTASPIRAFDPSTALDRLVERSDPVPTIAGTAT